MKVYTPAQIAEMFHVEQRTVRQWIADRKLKAFLRGGSLSVTEDYLRDALVSV